MSTNNLSAVAALALAIFAAASLAGWGALFRRVCRVPAGSVVIDVSIGLAVLLFIGGWLAFVSLVSKPVYALLIVAGLGFSALNASNDRVTNTAVRDRLRSMCNLHNVVTGLLVAAIVLFAAVTQLPPEAVNYHDDLQKYLAHPVRLLATGTLRAGPLGALGSETLGGMAYLHGFVHAFWPIRYVNGVDSARPQ